VIEFVQGFSFSRWQIIRGFDTAFRFFMSDFSMFIGYRKKRIPKASPYVMACLGRVLCEKTNA